MHIEQKRLESGRVETRLLRFNDDAIAEAAKLIRSGVPVAVPTETVYGLAADATSNDAVAAIFAAKGRPHFNPLIVHVADAETAYRIGTFSDSARALAAEHWPGPLTIVAPVNEDADIAKLALAGLTTIALRVPAHRAMQALLSATGLPLAAPSANLSGRISPTTAQHVMASLGGRIALIIDDGATPDGIESTIVAADARGLRVLRPGPIMLGPTRSSNVDVIEAPGQLAAHYAPNKPLRLNAIAAEPDEWLIGFGPILGNATLSAVGDAVEAAARLFDMLHIAEASDAARIAIAPIPEIGIGIAINDRLRRAAVGALKPR